MSVTESAELAIQLPTVMDAYPALFPPFVSAGRDAPGAHCNGVNHSDVATAGHCGRCGDPVARRGTAIYPLRTYRTPNGWERTAYMCYRPSHSCEATHVNWHVASVLLALSRGELLVGVPVRVVRGRKVPIGTEGIVDWAGETAYGEAVKMSSPALSRATFTNAANVELALPADLATLVAEFAAAEQERIERECAAERAAEQVQELHGPALAELAERELGVRRGDGLVGARVELLAWGPARGVLADGEVIGHHPYAGQSEAYSVAIPASGRTMMVTADEYGVRWKLA
jgi:hypothetical protein